MIYSSVLSTKKKKIINAKQQQEHYTAETNELEWHPVFNPQSLRFNVILPHPLQV